MSPDWPALRRLRRPGAAALGIWWAFLAFWQFAVPGGDGKPSEPGRWLVLGPFAVLPPLSLVLAASATRRLWRARRRAAALLPSALLVAGVGGFPWFADAAGLGGEAFLWSVQLAFLVSSLASAFFVSFASPGLQAPASDQGIEGWTKPAERP